ncbi:MAG: hypothetical protein ACI841_000325 [Planctomycetota bacterium]|jgi:hypothetical protein
MEPTTANLTGLNGNAFALAPQLTARGGASGVTVRADVCQLSTAGLTKVASGADTGFWVPYVTAKACVGFASGAKAWIASGPFSGCEFAIGRRGSDGAIFAAHIARESGSTGVADWEAYSAANDLKVWYRNAIPLPDKGAYSCSYVFARCEGNELKSLVRIDLRTPGMGGSDGTVFNVHTFK